MIKPHDLLQTESQTQTSDNADNPGSHLGLDEGSLLEALAEIEEDVPHTVGEVVGEGEAETELDTAVDDGGHVGKGLSQAGALDVPAQEGGDEVGGEVSVGDAGQGAAGDTGPGRVAEPGLVQLVDAQMGGDGAVETLLGKDLVTLLGGTLDGCDGTEQSMLVFIDSFCISFPGFSILFPA